MPKIFEYLGIIIFFYSNEHEPIHVHARKGGYESKAEFIIHNGEIVEIKIKENKGFKPLTGSDLNNFKDFLSKYAEKIIEKWVNYFVYRMDVEFERKNGKIR